MIDITRGGYAENTIIKSNTPLENEEGEAFCGIVIEVEIIYQHRINDPQQHT